MNAQIFRRTAAVAAAAALVALSAPAAAKDVDTRPTQAKASAGTTDEAVPKPQKYCIADTLTGSRVAKKICRTEAEWSRDGVEVAGK